ncbi:MAG: hypothetical protein QM785_17890 [Pyrinomonadaceae bacterium]
MKHIDRSDWLPGMGEDDDRADSPCINPEDGELVFASRSALTEEEKERADFHIGSCPACQEDMDFDHFYIRMLESTWATYAGE